MTARLFEAATRVATEWAGPLAGTALLGVTDGNPNLLALSLAGAAGAYVNAVWFPLETWRQRFLQGLAASLASLFMGGAAGVVLHNMLETGVWGFAFAGFVFAASGKEGLSVAKGLFAKR